MEFVERLKMDGRLVKLLGSENKGLWKKQKRKRKERKHVKTCTEWQTQLRNGCFQIYN